MLSFLLALVPIALIIFLMIGLRWGAARAGAAGYLSALLIAVLFFGAGPELLAYAHLRALVSALDVLFIIWAAFLFYRVADEAGAIRTIGNALPHVTADRGLQALIIGWVFASFLQGVGGFGVPVAVIAPILVSLGFTPLLAVIIPSLGHGWAVTFGSLGSSFQALVAATGQTVEYIAPAAGIILIPACLATGFMVAHAAQGWPAARRLALPILTFGLVMGFINLIVGTSRLWNIASFCAGMAGLLLAYPIARQFPGERAQEQALDRRALAIAASGYLILIAVTLAVQLIPWLYAFLGRVAVQLHFPEVRTTLGYVTPAGASRKIPLFGHAGATLIYAALLAYLVYRRAGRYSRGASRRILSGMLRGVMASSVSIASLVTMAIVMQNSGMTETLARGLAQAAGRAYPLVAPWIGALGAFISGSNTNSNVVFGALQLRTAELVGYSAAVILAAQTTGAGLGSLMAPTKIAVGTVTVDMVGREGDVMRKLVSYVLILLLLTSAVTLALIYIFPL